jgi:ATP-dependent RNA helicase DHX8/PRP22
MFSQEGKKFLQTLQESTETYIWWNWSSTFLRIFGHDNASNQVYREIDQFIQDRLQKRQYVNNLPIPQGCLRQCLRNTNKIKDLNDEKTSIEIIMIKRIIRISGEESAVKKCEQRIREFISTLEQTKLTTNKLNNTECPFCTCPCDSPYALQQCGHTYCRSCLMGYFETRFDPTLSIQAFKITCPIEKCNSPCLIRDIQSILGSEKLIRLAKAAFQIYLKKSGIDLVQCFGIDCAQVSSTDQHFLK